jgi:hypothetical protein
LNVLFFGTPAAATSGSTSAWKIKQINNSNNAKSKYKKREMKRE